MAMLRQTTETEEVLSRAADALANSDAAGADWGIETAFGILCAVNKVDGIELALANKTHERLDAYLEAPALDTDNRRDFEETLRNLARYGSSEHVPSRLARLLVTRKSGRSWLGYSWQPPSLNEDDILMLRTDARVKPMVDRFIQEILPFSSTDYDASIAHLLKDIAVDIESAFLNAINTVSTMETPAENIKTIVTGVCIGESPDYDGVIDGFARSRVEADNWLNNFAAERRAAEDHDMDPDYAAYLENAPADRYFNVDFGMQAIAHIRYQREGIDWIPLFVRQGFCKLIAC